ncbi:MAG: LUD domain-containing protein [Candidatus Ranarchaeia archaeon]
MIIQRQIDLLERERVARFRYKMFNEYIRKRDAAKMRYRCQQLEQEVRKIKEYAIAHLPSLIRLTMEAMKENGVFVTFAKTAEDARRAALKAIGDEQLVVQGSSDVPCEIDLDVELKRLGKQLVATGTYHRLFQLSGLEAGFNKGYSTRYYNVDDWRRVLGSTIGLKGEPGPEGLADAIVTNIKSLIESSNVAVTGANAVSADNGAIILTHGLGNLFRVALRRRHIVLVGIEKIVPTYIEAWKTAYLESLYSDSGGGTVYQFSVRGPSAKTEVEGVEVDVRLGSEEVHVILVDNGRLQAIREGFAEALYCIRCFSCHNHCPSYRALGPGRGNDFRVPGFGYKGYIGGQGTILSSFLFGLSKAVEAGLFTCTNCGACYQECPLKINVPKMIAMLRKRVFGV